MQPPSPLVTIAAHLFMASLDTLSVRHQHLNLLRDYPMLAQRSLLLIIFVLFFFEPLAKEWTASGAWYRPYGAWLAIVVTAFITQYWVRRRGS